MKIIHHIGASASGKEVKLFKKIGIQIPVFEREAITDTFYFNLYEDSEQYKALQPYMNKFNLFDTVVTEFTEKEKDEASILVIQPQWLNGYPQPEATYQYSNTYDYQTDTEENAYMDRVQRDPFRLKKAPNWSGGKKIFSLNWIFDELFVKKDFYEEVFMKYNIDFKPVFLYKKDILIEDTVQLVLPTTKVPLNLNGFEFEITKGGKKLYSPKFKGFFPAFEKPVDLNIWKSKEWFGSGQQSFKRIFITQQLRREFLQHKLKVDYIPVESNNMY